MSGYYSNSRQRRALCILVDIEENNSRGDAAKEELREMAYRFLKESGDPFVKAFAMHGKGAGLVAGKFVDY